MINVFKVQVIPRATIEQIDNVYADIAQVYRAVKVVKIETWENWWAFSEAA